ncbi:very short patch repair endonuclease [Candidatus Marsarchaeota archaeon]|nr:very short patch repair endonuclease [Candidatus Marsarchaeota archaeon]MCL5122870.1 very short patch repair endonuclease [Candidatus Marsarchaeota archaeon]
MADWHTKEQRSYNMSRIRGSKTGPELKLRDSLKNLGFTYQPKGIYGRPDFANRKIRTAVFIDGCFWHGCPEHYIKPKSNRGYWLPKIRKNAERDRAVNKHLQAQGWRVIRVWEHSLKKIAR